MLFLGFLSTGLLALMSLLSLSRQQVWWVRDCDFPRLIFASWGVVAVFLLPYFLGSTPAVMTMVAVNLACVVFQLWWIWPFTVFHAHEVLNAPDSIPADDRVRIMVSNVLMPNRNSVGLLEIVRRAKPDILVTVETDLWWEQQLSELEPEYPNVLRCPLDNLYGMHLYSKLPLDDAQIRFLVEEGRPSMHMLVTLRSGRRIRLHCLHPSPPSPTENDASTERDAELLVVGRKVAKARLPVIVTGDLNDVAWSATTRLFRKISGLLDPRIGRGMFNTFHAGHLFLRWPLDHLFHSRHFTLVHIERLPSFGSDHFPIVVELALEPQAAAHQHGLGADPEDQAWAEEKIAQEPITPADVPAPGES